MHGQWAQLAFVVEEVFMGHAHDATFLDDGDIALLGMLERLSAEEASRMVCGGNVASHARHVLFSVTAYHNAMKHGAPSFIADNWPEWNPCATNPEEWNTIRAELAFQVKDLLTLVKAQTDSAGQSYLLGLGALAHMAFHLGAIQSKYDVLKAK